ncbi:MAG: DUF1559 domain-containing protein [Armatimonadetes bacterium]|nr:DUF1559 domain-containing protein [Armatimonadota bacterium]
MPRQKLRFRGNGKLRFRGNAFTLIELLVVVAIIALLAAILFPTFATIRGNARRTACMNNAKQIGTAMMMYLQDFDELTPTPYSKLSTGVYTDVSALLQPYLKSQRVLFCPDRDENICGASDGSVSIASANKPCIGYGYNWGPSQNFYANRKSGGLLDAYETSMAGNYARALGRPLADVLAPASTWAFGDTHDTTWYTISADSVLSRFSGDRNSRLQHGGCFSMIYMDGHAKPVRFRGGFSTTGSNRVALPRDPTQYANWCADPDAVITTEVGTMPCKNVGAAFATSVTRWFAE